MEIEEVGQLPLLSGKSGQVARFVMVYKLLHKDEAKRRVSRGADIVDIDIYARRISRYMKRESVRRNESRRSQVLVSKGSFDGTKEKIQWRI